MRPAVLLLAVLSLAASDPHKGITQAEIDKIVDAIYKTEGGTKARKPFGILSVPCNGYAECRRICENTIRNNHKRWMKSERNRVDFLTFLAGRYCPKSVDPVGHKNWIKNMRRILI